MQRYRFEMRKYDGSLHRTWTVLGALEHGPYRLYGYRSAELRYPATGRRIAFDRPALHVTVPSVGKRLITMWFSDTGVLEGIYVDVGFGPALNPDTRTVRFVDLDLDVVARAEHGFEPRVLDWDEFRANRRRMGYPPEVVRTAQFTARATSRIISLRRGAIFGRPPEEWFGLLREILRQGGEW